jgi:hypothetical protein
MTLKELQILNRDCDYSQIAPSFRSDVYDHEGDTKSQSRQNKIYSWPPSWHSQSGCGDFIQEYSEVATLARIRTRIYMTLNELKTQNRHKTALIRDALNSPPHGDSRG